MSLNTTSLVADDLSQNISLIWQFSYSYRLWHGWVSAITCLFGIPCNLLNIIVLTQPNMVKSPTNLILSGMAFADLLTMVAYLPWSIFLHEPEEQPKHPDSDTLFKTHYLKLHIMVCVTLHGISIWFTVYLAIYRYVFLKTASPVSNSSTNNQRLKAILKNIEKFFVQCRSYNSTVAGMLVITIFVVIFCIPAYLFPEVTQHVYNETSVTAQDIFGLENNSDHPDRREFNQSVRYFYDINESKLAKAYSIGHLMFYSQAIFAKLVPCLLLITFTSLLINSLITINKNKKKLSQGNNYTDDHKNDKKKKDNHSPENKRLVSNSKKNPHSKRNPRKENFRTTLMLIVVCILFLITEFPQCIILLLSRLWDETYYSDVYMPLGDLFDIVALINNSINFLLYCSMSKAFRETFYTVMSKYFNFQSNESAVTQETPMHLNQIQLKNDIVKNKNLTKPNNDAVEEHKLQESS